MGLDEGKEAQTRERMVVGGLRVGANTYANTSRHSTYILRQVQSILMRRCRKCLCNTIYCYKGCSRILHAMVYTVPF